MMAKIVQFIHAEVYRGLGSKDDPSRLVQQLWTKDGYLVAEYDPFDATRSFYQPVWKEDGSRTVYQDIEEVWNPPRGTV